jgi:hypothetical protein
VLDLSRRPYVTLPVRSDGRLFTTGFSLRRGTSYVVTAAGSYGYGGATQVADASCRWAPVRRTWVPYPTAAAARAHGSLDLLVAGTAVSGPVCRPDHVYTRTIRPAATAPLRLRVANTPAGATGTMTVLVSAAGTDVRAGLPTTPTDPRG